ncbi:MAG: response regulator, partial [Gammaproteobacteria bacterium]
GHSCPPRTMKKDADKVILLVEDNEDDVLITQWALQSAGVKNPLHIVRDGQEAVDYLSGTLQFADRQKFPFPGLVLLDLKLPYRSGLEILEWMRAQSSLPTTVVAVLTSSNEPKDLQRAYALGAKTYLVKPPTAQMIHDIAEGFNLDWLGRNPALNAETMDT